MQNLLKARPLPLDFYRRDAAALAQDLLGKVLVVQGRHGPLAVRLVEVEAYLGAKDPASHAFRGQTPRNAAMFAAGGVCYVYLSYGMHHCVNVVAGAAGTGAAVLLRAGQPLIGLEEMAERRGLNPSSLWSQPRLQLLTSGPGRLAQALGLDLDFYGRPFTAQTFKIVSGPPLGPEDVIAASPRIGISRGTDLLLRYCLINSPYLSRRSPQKAESASGRIANETETNIDR